MRGRYFCFCSCVPKAIITGAIIVWPKGMNSGAPSIESASLKTWRCSGLQPGPPHSLGQAGTDQPR